MPRQKLIPTLTLTLTLTLAAVTVLFLFSITETRESWRRLPQQVGFGENIGQGAKTTPGSRGGGALAGTANDLDWNPRHAYKKGQPMPPGYNYTSMLVIAKTREENIAWIAEHMPDQPVTAYVADDPNAPLHPPKNKGHEVMIYLSWIIDNYDNLPDVSIFMHAHHIAWHNNDLLGSNAHLMVTRLSRQRVWREGFVNMRCIWGPGCPDWMHPGTADRNANRPEEQVIADSWNELFPLEEVPNVLGAICCAQFALSRDRIRAVPHAQYVRYRDWLLNSRLPDNLSGRIWEYLWHVLFTGLNVYCPVESVCYCDQYGTCFGGVEAYADFLALRQKLGDREWKLRDWQEQKKKYDEYQGMNEEEREALLKKDPKPPKAPEAGKPEEWQPEIDRLKPIVEKLLAEAEERGKDPKNRAFEAGREWHDGDDF